MTTTNTRPLTPIYPLDDLRPEGVYNKETLRMFMENLEPTEEDVARQLTDEELKEICIRHKCRVDAYRWNPVYDYKRCLHRKGILDCRSMQHQLRHLAKAVNRHKQTIMYDEENLKKIRETEWRIRKKDSILSLELWAYQREKEQESQTVVMTDMELDVPAPEGQQQLSESLENTEFHPVLSEEPQIPVLIAGTKPVSTPRVPLGGYLFPSQILDVISETELSNIIDDTVCIDGSFEKSELNSVDLQARGATKEVCRVFDVHTESMTLYDSEESEAPLLSQEQQSDLQSQEVFHKEYEEFGNDIPLTSTQSQN